MHSPLSRFLRRTATALLLFPLGNLFAQTLSWTQRSPGTPSWVQFNDAAYGGGKYVVVGYGHDGTGIEGRATVSSDGATWTPVNLPNRAICRAIAHDGTRFATPVEGSGTQHILTSTDGLTWTPKETGAGDLWTIAHGTVKRGGVDTPVWLAMGSHSGGMGAVQSTDGGQTWSRLNTGLPGDVWGMTFGNGQFLARVTNAGLYRSADGLSWTPVALPGLSSYNSNAVDFDGQYLRASIYHTPGAPDRIYRSSDGVQWTAETKGDLANGFMVSSLSSDGSTLCVGGGSFGGPPDYLGSAGLQYGSLSGGSITSLSALTGLGKASEMRCVHYANGLWIAGSNGNELYTAGTAGGGGTPPAITTQPLSQFVTLHATVTFSITVTGSGVSYQWYFNGNVIVGATQSSYTLTGVGAAHAGEYRVKVSNAYGELTSSTATLSLAGLPVISTAPVSQAVSLGGSVSFSVTATGGGLVYQWYKNDVAIQGAVSATLSLSKLRLSDAGAYKVKVSNGGGEVVSQAASLVLNYGRMSNASILAESVGKDTPLIAGFVVSGGSKQLLIRGAGPALGAFGVTGSLANPRLDLHSSASGTDQVLATNENWEDSAAASILAAAKASGAFAYAAGSLDAALLTLADGPRSVHVYDATNRSGTTLVELYDAEPDSTASIKNLSVRNQVGAGGKVLTLGFVIEGNQSRRMLVRGVGPALGAFGVAGYLRDPRMEVFRIEGGQASSIASNDNWGSGDVPALRTAFSSVGAFNLSDSAGKDAVLVLDLAPGQYTAQVGSVDGTSGEALVELYELP